MDMAFTWPDLCRIRAPCGPFVSDPGSVHVCLCGVRALCDVVCVGCLSLSDHVLLRPLVCKAILCRVEARLAHKIVVLDK